MFTEDWTATSEGVPFRWKPPTPLYKPSEFSRTTTMFTSSSACDGTSVCTPGYRITGRRFTY